LQIHFITLFNTRSALGGAGPNVVLCKTCSVLLCVLQQPIVDNCSGGALSTDSNWFNQIKASPDLIYILFFPCGNLIFHPQAIPSAILLWHLITEVSALGSIYKNYCLLICSHHEYNCSLDVKQPINLSIFYTTIKCVFLSTRDLLKRNCRYDTCENCSFSV
jgi:hypothetical protein